MPSADAVQDNDNDTHSLASDASEGEAHSRISRDHDPEVENLTSHSRRRRRRTRRRTMGMERPEYINKGNDPFDYEKKFAEDKRCEELGSAARVWRIYLEECAASDGEMVEGWRDGLDVLLVFAGLFSAVVTTFVAQTSQSLQVDYGKVTTLLLIELINVQRSASNGSLVNNVPRSDLTFRPSTSDSCTPCESPLRPFNVVRKSRLFPSSMHVLSNNRHDTSPPSCTSHLPPSLEVNNSPTLHLSIRAPSASLPLIRHGLLDSVLCIQWTAYLKLDVAYGLAVDAWTTQTLRETSNDAIYVQFALSASTFVKLASSLTLAPAVSFSAVY